MTTGNVEERLAKLEYEVERQKATSDCHRLMGRYAYLHATHRMEDLYELFAKIRSISSSAPAPAIRFSNGTP